MTFTVTDSGIGLKPAEIKRLFRPFVQANADIARRYGGAGLGLAVVKVLAKLMGGDLTVTSKHGHGSSFTLSVVLAVAPADTAADAHRSNNNRRRDRLRSFASKTTRMAASSSTPSSPNSVTAPISSAPAKKRSRRWPAATTRC